MKNENLEAMRHSCEHVLHQALIKLYPKIKPAMGPATDEGFYIDLDCGDPHGCKDSYGLTRISEKDFEEIEKEMAKIIKQNLTIVRKEVAIDEARKLFEDNPYKLEWLDEINKKGGKATVYYTGENFVDLCAGPHVASTGKIGPFKLLSVAGAYWHGDEKNKMLTRVYGTCFPTQKELDDYLKLIEEAKKRDHRKLGKDLDLFVIDENIGRGLPLLTPKGTVIKDEILNYEAKLEKEAGFMRVSCPHIARSELYKKTGHWAHYRDSMYEAFGIEGEEYVLKPMNCPHHYMIYASRPRSYKNLPIRLSEPGTCYRFEKSGELSGLLRVRSITIDDSHTLMREDQIEDEFKTCIEMVKKMYQAFNLKDYYVRLSLADPTDAVKYIADESTWKKAGSLLEKIVKDNDLKYVIAKGEASFYGPKIDFMVKDSLGREWQMTTLQLDLFMGKRLGLTYIDEDGKEKNPVILHRGLTGSIERTLAILIEHYAGAFPLWLSPVQVVILPVSDKFAEYGKIVLNKLKQYNIRAELNTDKETLGKKIRQSTLQKVPYMIIIGEKESESLKSKVYKVAVRTREGKDLGLINLYEFIEKLKNQIEKFL